MRPSWGELVRFWQRYVYLHQNLSDLLRFCFIGCVKEIWEHYYITTFCECQPFWCEKLMDAICHWLESLPGIESDPARLNWMAGPLFPSFTGLVPLPLMDRLPGIELDGADSQALSPRDGVEKCQKWSLLPTHSNGPSWLPGIEPGKMLEAVASSNLFKWTQPTHGHSNRPRTFIFILHWVSSRWLTHSVFSCAHLAHLKMH